MTKPLVKLQIAFLLTLIFAFGAAAQDSPSCVLREAPRLLDLSLGMSPTQVQSVFGKDLKFKVKASGDRVFFQNYIGKPARGKLAGVRALYLRFLDGSLYQIEIFYDERRAAPTLEAFAAELVTNMNLPSETTWTFAKNRALIECGAARIVADQPVDPRVELTDTTKLAEAEARRKKK
jgi:hypothetical protein